MRLLKYVVAILIAVSAQAADVSNLQLGGRVARATTVTEFNLNQSTFALDATTDAFGCVMQMPVATTITQCCWTNGFKTGTAPTYRCSLQSIGTTGFNSGTILGGGSPASCTFANAAYAGDGAGQCCTLSNSYTNTRGEAFAVHVDYSTGTINGSNYIEYAYGLVGADAAALTALPYSYLTTAGTPAKAGAGRFPVCYVKSASATFGYPGTDIEVTAYSSDSTPDEYALAFTVPADTCDTYTIKGVSCLIRRPAASKTLDVKLYTGKAQLQILDNWDGDWLSSTGSSGERSYVDFLFTDSSLTALDCGSQYRIGFVPNETSSNFGLAVLDTQTAGELSALPGGTAFFLSTRTDAGAWTDVTDKRPFCDLIFGDETDPAGGGGGETTTGSQFNRGFN